MDNGDTQRQFRQLVLGTPWMRHALEAAREVGAPDWLIGAGAIRDVVWDHLHGIREPMPPKDIDLVFFDAAQLEGEREAQCLALLRKEAPEIPWHVKNQAAVHLWYPIVFGIRVDPLASAEEAVATWPETATSVAVRLLHDDVLQIVAPMGLDDLFGLVCRRNPRRVTVREYRRRVRAKRIAERWPMVTILD